MLVLQSKDKNVIINVDEIPRSKRGARGFKLANGIFKMPMLTLHLLPGQEMSFECNQCKTSIQVVGDGTYKRLSTICALCAGK